MAIASGSESLISAGIVRTNNTHGTIRPTVPPRVTGVIEPHRPITGGLRPILRKSQTDACRKLKLYIMQEKSTLRRGARAEGNKLLASEQLLANGKGYG